MRTFCKDLSHIIPNIIRVNRGKLSLEGVAEKALALDAENVAIIDRWKGGAGKIRFFKIRQDGLVAVPPTIYVRSVMLGRDFGERVTKGRRIESVAIAVSLKENSEVKGLENLFSDFFDIPVIPFSEATHSDYDAAMQISTDPSNHIIVTFKLIPELVEVGPQIRISNLIWELTG